MSGAAVGVEDAALEVHNPYLGDAGAGVKRELHRAVVAEGAVGDLDQEQDVGGAGAVAGGVEVGPRAEHGEVGLRLVEAVEADRVLGPHDGFVQAGQYQSVSGAAHGGGVALADGRRVPAVSFVAASQFTRC